jgi:hypothetical protein
MQDVFQDETLNGWILTPAANLIEFVVEEQKTCASTIKGYFALRFLPDLLSLLQHHLPVSERQLSGHLAEMAMGAPSDAAFARAEIDANFATIFAHHTIAVWAAVETTLEQIVISYLLRTPNSREKLLELAPTLKAGKVKTDTRQAAKRALSQWEATLDDPSTLGRALTMLAALGFNAEIPKEPKRDLDEMSGIRNIVLHRAGFVDDEFLQKCPWHKTPIGGRLRIDRPMMDRYFNAASALAMSLIGAVVKSPHIRVQP